MNVSTVNLALLGWSGRVTAVGPETYYKDGGCFDVSNSGLFPMLSWFVQIPTQFQFYVNNNNLFLIQIE